MAFSENLVNFTFSDPRADPPYCIFSARIIQKYPKNEDLDEDPHEDLFLKTLATLSVVCTQSMSVISADLAPRKVCFDRARPIGLSTVTRCTMSRIPQFSWHLVG